MKNTPVATKTPVAKKPALVTAPSPLIVSRQVKRHIAVCVVATTTECEFPNRTAPDLHSTAESARVESARHLRAAHADLLSLEVTATRKRQVVNESIEIA